jgi:lipopolysaccharide biosynthesis glycosyltransferase
MSPKHVVAMAADARMLPAAAYLATRLAELNRRDDVEVAIYSDSAPDLMAARDFGVPASLKLVDFARHFPAAGRVSPAAFFRLFLPDVVADSVERIIYVDVDVALDDARLLQLLDLDMRGHAIAACRDLTGTFEHTPQHRSEIELSGPGGKSLYSGMLVIDRARYLAMKHGRRMFETAERLRLHDQAAMNAVLRGDWLELSPAMNMTTPIWNSFIRQAFPPSIVHFLGAVKPWSAAYAEDHPVRAFMERYFASSPWPNFVRRPDFAQVWQKTHPGLQKSAPPAKLVLSPAADVAGMADLLRRTTFADVEQGISSFHPTAIP